MPGRDVLICRHDHFVAYFCKGRDVCPSYNTRRMAEKAVELAGLDLLDIFSLDYALASLLQSALLLCNSVGWAIPKAVNTVTINPAHQRPAGSWPARAGLESRPDSCPHAR